MKYAFLFLCILIFSTTFDQSKSDSISKKSNSMKYYPIKADGKVVESQKEKQHLRVIYNEQVKGRKKQSSACITEPHNHYFSNLWDEESIKKDAEYTKQHKNCNLPRFNRYR